MNSHVAERFAAIVPRLVAERDAAYDPSFSVYHADLRSPEGCRRYVRYILDVLKFGNVDPRGLSVLDVGCGFGMALVVCGLLGARELHGIDLKEGRLNTIRSYRAVLPQAIAERLFVRRADASAIPYWFERFDLVLCLEAVSHYYDVSAALAEASRVLKPGGKILIADGNNGCNPDIRQKTADVWEAFERGSENQHVHGHVVATPFVQVRAQMIHQALPELSQDSVTEMARATSGMTQAEIQQACTEFRSEGVIPGSYYSRGQVPVNPQGRDVVERLFDPYELGRQVRKLGLRVKVRGYWGGANGSFPVRLANGVLAAASPLAIRTARAFRIAAMKPA